MTHDELLAKMKELSRTFAYEPNLNFESALRAVVELHKPSRLDGGCAHCKLTNTDPRPYPCPTIQAIEKELA